MQDFAQLYVETSSSLVNMVLQTKSSSTNTNTNTNTSTSGGLVPAVESGPEPVSESVSDGMEVEGKGMTMEIGKHVISADERGDEIAMRNVKLDHVEGASVGGYDENIFFEEGVQYKDKSVNSGNKTKLHHIDEAILLAMCLDVENSNPRVSTVYACCTV